MFRLHTASLLQVMRSTGHAWSYKAWCSAVISCFFDNSDWCISILAVHSVICSLGGLLSHGSPVVVSFNCGHPHFWNFYSTISVDVVRVKSYINCFSVQASRMSRSCSLILSCIGFPVPLMYTLLHSQGIL